MRIECGVRPYIPDGRSETLTGRLSRSVPGIRARVLDVYLVDDRYDSASAVSLLVDAVTTEVTVNGSARDAIDPEWTHAVEITVKPGVTDPVAATVDTALADLDVAFDPVGAQTARQIVFHAPNLPLYRISALCGRLYNPLIQYASIIVRHDDLQREADAIPGDGSRREDRSEDATILPVVQEFPTAYPRAGNPHTHTVSQIPLDDMDDAQLSSLNRKRLLALNSAELSAIRDFYARPEVIAGREDHGLSGATDVELEMLAQTWSEHCKHKIFSAQIDVDGRFTVDGLFKRCIAAVTDSLSQHRDDLLSVFDDNSGVVRFDDEYAVCFKAETHNSPSALDPYGGAITGIVGVNRDILGTGRGAKPIFNTNVLCFADPACPDEEVPPSLLPPGRVLEGVHEGIVDGGNQSGIPVVAGAFLFDDSYLGKPLVFCGTGGILPNEVDGTPGWHKGARPGDVVVMVGGRIGKDGIHGATFSSLALDETSPTSAVQIGDPITQKKMIDFLLEARDEGLMSSLTDNGAGGLSSSLGEMARESGGIHVDLDRCPVKYEGLAPWEIWVSESQERMSAAVPPEHLERFFELARTHESEATAIGTFTDDGKVSLYHEGRPVGMLDLDFLHGGLPRMHLSARWITPEKRGPRPPEHSGVRRAGDGNQPGEERAGGTGGAGRQSAPGTDADDRTNPAATDTNSTGRATPAAGNMNPAAPGGFEAQLLSVLRDPNVASKESLVRRYDHEVQAGTVGKPFVGREADGPADGGVVRPRRNSPRGLSVTHGACPRYGDWDAYRMAACAVDEAFRAHIALGGNPDAAWGLDNFCWPDPVESERTPDGAFKLAQLVRACRGLADACLTYGIPLISGKDSMKNDARSGDRTISVRPTLLVSLLGAVEDTARSLGSDFRLPGDYMYLLGYPRGELGGTSWERLFGPMWEPSPLPDLAANLAVYRAFAACAREGLVASAHDVSDGGLAVTLAESALGGRLGCDVDIASNVSLHPVLATPAVDSADPDPAPVFDAYRSTAGEHAGGGARAAAAVEPAAGPGQVAARDPRAAGSEPDTLTRLLFGESAGCIVATVAPQHAERFEALFDGLPAARLGTVTGEQRVRVRGGARVHINLNLETILDAWQSLNARVDQGAL